MHSPCCFEKSCPKVGLALLECWTADTCRNNKYSGPTRHFWSGWQLLLLGLPCNAPYSCIDDQQGSSNASASAKKRLLWSTCSHAAGGIIQSYCSSNKCKSSDLHKLLQIHLGHQMQHQIQCRPGCLLTSAKYHICCLT